MPKAKILKVNGEKNTASILAFQNDRHPSTIRKYALNDAYLVNRQTNKVLRANPLNLALLKQEFNVKTNKARKFIKGLDLPDNWELQKNIKPETNINMFVRVKATWRDVSEKRDRRVYLKIPNLNISKEDFQNKDEREEHFKNALADWAESSWQDIFPYMTKLKFEEIKIRSGNQALDFSDMEIREQNNLLLFNRNLLPFECNDFVKEYQKKCPKIKKIIDPETCIKQYLLLTYPKYIFQSYLNKYNKITLKILKNICIEKKIMLKAYGIDGKIKEETQIKNNKNKILSIVVYNNHLYPIKNLKIFKGKLRTMTHDNINNVVYIERFLKKDKKRKHDKLKEKLIEIITTEKSLPEVIFDDTVLISFMNGDIIYTSNKHYKLVFKILCDLGLKNEYYPHMTLSKCLEFVIKANMTENYKKSFAPYLSSLIKSSFYYYNKELYKKYKHDKKQKLTTQKLMTVDKNKCFSLVLSKLPFLPYHDCTYHNITKCSYNEHNVNLLIDEYFYNVVVDVANLLIPNNFIYNGLYLKICKKICPTLKFTIINEIECDINDNFYSEAIDRTYKLYGSELKHGWNITIGKMAQFNNSGDLQEKYKFNKICNKDELKRHDSNLFYKEKLSDDLYAIFDVKEEPNIKVENDFLTNFMIKDFTRLELYKSINENKIKDEHIIQIKVDSISFLKQPDQKYEFFIDAQDYTKWKTEDFHPLKNKINYYNEEIKLFTEWKPKPKEPEINFEGGFYDGYAGCGKTYFIINKLIPKLNDDYIILTPQHTNNVEYLKLGYRSEIMHKYLFNQYLNIEQKYIIVDEVGLFNDSMRKILYKYQLKGHVIYLFGDNRQLKPVNCNDIMTNPYIIKKLAKNNYYFFDSNYRNTYTKKEYEKMFNNELTLNQKVKYMANHNKKKINQESYTVICYYKESVNQENEKIMKKLNIENILSINCLVRCITNDLRQYEIYNNFILKVINKDENNIILSDEIKEYTIPIKKYIKSFVPGYARTLHSVQGSNLSNYLICTNKKDIQKFTNPRELYTLLSRFKDKKSIGKYNKKNNKISISFN